MDQVIGEIGGSSSRWAWLRTDGSVITWPAKGERFPGFNPVSGEGEVFSNGLRQLFSERGPEVMRSTLVRVYAAGCGADDRVARMRKAIEQVWTDAEVLVGSDLTGTAIGMCDGQDGLVLILGTGMNVGHFVDGRLHCPMPSLGYLLGDEGSGADIGRSLLQDAFYGRIRKDLHEELFGSQGPILAEVLGRIHRAPHPARELAAFTALLAPHLDRPYVRELIQGRFHALIDILEGFFTLEQRRKVFATGSVAFGFREVLAECLLDRGMSLTAVEADPLPGLVRYHQRQGSQEPRPPGSTP